MKKILMDLFKTNKINIPCLIAEAKYPIRMFNGTEWVTVKKLSFYTGNEWKVIYDNGKYTENIKLLKQHASCN